MRTLAGAHASVAPIRASATIMIVPMRVRPECDCRCAPERSASARVQRNGGAVAMIRGELVFDGVAISDTNATVRRPLDARAGRPSGRRAGAGLRRTGAVCRGTAEQFSWPMAPSRSAGTARSRARGRCARPGAHTHARARALVALVSGAGTGTGTGLDAVPSRQHETAARTHARTHACTHARMHAALVVLVSAALVLELALD